MEWLLAHSDDTEVVPECVSADSTIEYEKQTRHFRLKNKLVIYFRFT